MKLPTASSGVSPEIIAHTPHGAGNLLGEIKMLILKHNFTQRT